VAFDDKVVQYQKYTSSGTFQLFLKVLAPLASTHSPNPAGSGKATEARPR
jgi:hypothetical protein